MHIPFIPLNLDPFPYDTARRRGMDIVQQVLTMTAQGHGGRGPNADLQGKTYGRTDITLPLVPGTWGWVM